ncbi:MAG: acyl carrier protein [Opitutaceae bacterium]|nr:acyl carrier protein [Opitutaceae bacterium]
MKTRTPPPPAAPASVPEAADALLRHFPAEVREAYLRVVTSRDPAATDTLVLAIVADHMPRAEAGLADDAKLMADLGFDSVTIAEMVFFFEDLLKVSVTNAEIVRVRTVADLRAFVRHKIASLPRA